MAGLAGVVYLARLNSAEAGIGLHFFCLQSPRC